MKIDEIKELMKFFEASGIGKVKIKQDDFEIELKRSVEVPEFTPDMCPTPIPQAVTPQPINLVVNGSEAHPKKDSTINSPMVGTFYMAPSPGAKPFVSVGQTIRKGEVVGIIEAMKIMNEIEAEFDCRVLDILVADGQPVEYDMPIIEVEKL
ncbi:acetyl-CoA carboxylase biotin carboxyl carrier protein [Campylobacter corcagiensis]|uniref:Biotin carboxyl carrier protein of acetyl-CoA carboxylase n=1 Tax=Campylobacter corcagiensis TaxID=1448857 RepID=A0A7M1LJP9_9BACT|nr:acetyl-CoA carboxylase biotin carboxyl carrier protein [Campylobacter corcagiensis]QKF65387.1 acetyl-CoA carboxylase, biotin carboxyl carrier protein [Campylobacter corcagiensis]QOQ88036.1 acetyl-CoA carboxylase biotin carboxyl carrier protein [Campylobacter corcagiensis]